MGFLQRAAVIAALFMPAGIAATPVQAQSEPRHYDCSKAGNADKAVCKVAAANVQAPASASSGATKTRHYDCTKPGNADKEACKTAAVTATATPRPVAASGGNPAAPNASRENDDPKGAIARCKDGKYSHAAHREGVCSDHGGVAEWLSN